jgi:hypothetical protein
LEQLEQLTEQQADRIGNLTDLVGRLQKENYSLKSAKFQEELMKGGMGMARHDMTWEYIGLNENKEKKKVV